MSIFEIVLALLSAVLITGVFAYSIKQNKNEKKPPIHFIRELFNHFGDGNNFKRQFIYGWLRFILAFVSGRNMYLFRISITMKPSAIPRHVTTSVVASDTAVSCFFITMQYII